MNHLIIYKGGDGRKLMERNITVFVSADGPATQSEADYDRFVADVWVCVALTLMILSCIGLLCSCMLYHKLQQWKHHAERSVVVGEDGDADSLPSYTLVTGLPTYEQALARMEEGKEPSSTTDTGKAPASSSGTAVLKQSHTDGQRDQRRNKKR